MPFTVDLPINNGDFPLMYTHHSAANFHRKVGDESLAEHGFCWVVKPGQNPL